MKPTSEIGSKEYNDEAYQELSQKSMEPCPGCNRTFMPDRLEVHLRSCLKGKAIVKEEEESYEVPKIQSHYQSISNPDQ